MSSGSEDTLAVMDISPYPDSMDSNEGVFADAPLRSVGSGEGSGGLPLSPVRGVNAVNPVGSLRGVSGVVNGGANDVVNGVNGVVNGVNDIVNDVHDTGKKQPLQKAQEEEEDPEEWEFRCVCGLHGHNYDDGLPMVQCCECNCWSHTACVKYRVGSADEFVCRWCKERKKKNPGMKWALRAGMRGRIIIKNGKIS